MRMTGWLKVLDEGEEEVIYEVALRILNEVGVLSLRVSGSSKGWRSLVGKWQGEEDSSSSRSISSNDLSPSPKGSTEKMSRPP